MKIRSITAAALASALLLPLTLHAGDETPPPAAKTEASATSAHKGAKADPRCEPTAQTRIRKNKAQGCIDIQPTRSYSREELENTGQTDTAEALKRLDPRFH